MHMIPGWPKVSYMFSCLRWCYAFCVKCGFFAFWNFLSSILYVGLLCFLFVTFMSYVGILLFFINVFYVIRGFLLSVELSTLLFLSLCLWHHTCATFFFWSFILVFVFSMLAMGFWTWICYYLLSLCPCVFLLLFVVILMFKGCELKGWNLELGTWEERIEACKHHILIH
jgi:hypothetical protein